MQINLIQQTKNQNLNQTNFRAKIQFDGAHKELPKELVSKFEGMVKRIGNDKDIVSIKIGEKYERTTTWSEMGHPYEATDYFRDNSIVAFVNGELKQQDLKTNANWGIVEDMKNVNKRVSEYLESLIKNNDNK